MIAAAPYILPFFLFAVITYSGPLFNLPQTLTYPLKTVVVGSCLIYSWKVFTKEITLKMDWLAFISGIFVFLVWILLEGHYPQLGSEKNFNFPIFDSRAFFLFFVSLRFLGASVIVPITEELFWRSFALRFLIDTNFKLIPLGTFTWFSFILGSVAFGLEHHRWLPGIVAGMVYALLIYRSRNLFSPILSHGVTNFLLGIHVITTDSWQYW